MTEKDNVSMATVQMKADYAASEVYSTASEPPPAYKRQANSVKIAKITAFTIIVSSFVLGAFILASSYLQAKASCDQVQALDSVLEKELMLETLQQVNKELPRAEALLGKENSDESDLQNLDKDETNKKVDFKPQAMTPQTSNEEEVNDSENSYSEANDNEEMSKFPGKVPLELDLSDLAATLLRNNKKSRMNCVVERKHAEEIVDSPSKTVALPFGVNLKTDPKKARITGERISIFCDGGDDNKENESRNNREEADDETEDDAEPMRPMFIPYERLPIRFGRFPQLFPLTHMPQRMMPPVQLQQQPQRMMPPMQMQQQPQQQQQPQHQIPQQSMMRQMPPLPPFHQLPLRPPMPPQVMQAPQPEQSRNMIYDEPPQQQTVRIHLQQIPFREIHVSRGLPVQIPSSQQELPHFQIQRLPLGEALERAGITSEDLRNIQRMAEVRLTDDDDDDSSTSDEINNSNDDSSNENEQSLSRNSSSEEQDRQQQSAEQQSPQQQHQIPQEEQEQQPQQTAQQSEQRQEQTEERDQPMMPQQPARLILQPLPEQPTQNLMSPMGRVVFGRSLAQPVRIPVPMMQAQADASNDESDRPHSMSQNYNN